MIPSPRTATSTPSAQQLGADAPARAWAHAAKLPRVLIAPDYVRAYGPVHVCRTVRRTRAKDPAATIDPTRLALVLGCLAFWCLVATWCWH